MTKLVQDLDKLKIFVTVAEKGKINQAAHILHLTQPSISRAIQKLEDSFGAVLFTRSREGVQLTKAGRLLYEQASAMLHKLEDVQAQAQHMDEILAGHLTVGTYETLAEYLWPDFLMHFHREHPHLQISLKTSLSKNPLSDLMGGRIDLLVDAEPNLKSAVVSWPLYTDKFAFYIAADNKLAAASENSTSFKSSAKTDELTQMPIIYVRQTPDENGLAIEDHFEKIGLRFAREYCFDSFSTAKRMAIKGLGLVVLPMRLAEEDERKKGLRRVTGSGLPQDSFGRHTIYATVNETHAKDVRLKKIITQLKNHFSTRK